MRHFDPSDLESWLYYSGFALSNIMLPILVVGLFVGGQWGWRFTIDCFVCYAVTYRVMVGP